MRHRAEARRILEKIEAYAADASALANNVKRIKGEDRVIRLRVGSFRVLLVEDEAEIQVLDIGPRSSIYDR